ncbi:MAG: hypothetical protein Q4C46_12030 [Bacillota bacterium]|nr:hypothetical protein [Bacillota bacterium]
MIQTNITVPAINENSVLSAQVRKSPQTPQQKTIPASNLNPPTHNKKTKETSMASFVKRGIGIRD